VGAETNIQGQKESSAIEFWTLIYKWSDWRKSSLSPSFHSPRAPGTVTLALLFLSKLKQKLSCIDKLSPIPSPDCLLPSFYVLSLTEEALGEVLDDILQSCLKILAESALLVDGGEELRLIRLEVGKEVRFPLQDLVDRNRVEETVDTGEDEGDHLVDGHGGVLLLLQELGQLQIWLY